MPQKVLVVDDSKSIVAMIRYSLERAGYEVLVAHDGEEGLQRLEEAGGADLIICDLNMPRMDGFAMLRAVKASAHSSIPFVVLSIEAQENMRQQARDLGARAWIIKPFKEEQLLGAVRKFIK